MSSGADAGGPAGDANGASEAAADVLILGASFTGIELLYQLRRRPEGRALQVTIVDRHRRHGYLPLVHERLCGRLGPGESELDTAAAIDRDADARFIEGEIVGLDPEAKEVSLADGRRLRGRFVVVALGSILEPPAAIAGREALAIYKLADEQRAAAGELDALLRGDGDGDAPVLTVIGGGISGVELAGELAHLAKTRPEGWRAPRVVLVHGGERLLPTFAARVAARTRRYLEAQGVELRLGARVVAAEEGRVRVRGRDGEEVWLRSDRSYWSGGIRPAPVLDALGLPRTAAGWLEVGPTLQCFPTARPSLPDIFAGGDAARIVGADGEWPTMQRAIECLWQADVLARNILALAAEPAGYPSGVPPLEPHRLRRDFFHGISLGGRSLVVYGPLMLDVAGLNTWFRRFLMRSYFRRYTG
ncbi:MAG: FAD-dependent oxidoreductase [Myxococcales bacterium]|nr:FAD-dependent oxidoreductase [Myxococcales bacterium]